MLKGSKLEEATYIETPSDADDSKCAGELVTGVCFLKGSHCFLRGMYGKGNCGRMKYR